MKTCICICPMPDGSLKAHMDTYDGDEADGQTFASAEELMAALPGLIEQAGAGSEGDAPMIEGEEQMAAKRKMEDEAAMVSGFKGVRGGGL